MAPLEGRAPVPDPNMSADKLEKVYFKLLQAIHHSEIIAQTKCAGKFPVSMSRHTTKLTAFVKPSSPTETTASNKYTASDALVWKSIQLESKNVVYFIDCKMCKKLYVGQTQHKLLDRLKQHLYHINITTKMSVLYDHFQPHGADNLRITGLESQPHWSAAQRIQAERLWIAKLNTGVPMGLNEIL